jgi:acyl dehydratase
MRSALEPKLSTEFRMSQQAIDAFGALVGKRVPHLKRKPGTGHHSDPEAAKSVGLRGPVAYSLHYYAHVAHLMTERFGPRFLNGGEMAVSFIKPVCAGDDLRVAIGERPVQRVEQQVDDRELLQVDIYNQLGELVAAGTVSMAADATA